MFATETIAPAKSGRTIPDPITIRFNKTDFRVYTMRAICWRILYEKRHCPPTYREALQRRTLLDSDLKLTALGERYAKRWNDAFMSMALVGSTVSDEPTGNMKSGGKKRVRKQR